MSEKKLRIAICLSGQPRFFKEGHAFLYEHIIQHYDTDVFFHTWHDESEVGKAYDGAPHSRGKIGSVLPNTIEKIVEIYNPVDYKIETPRIPFIEGIQRNPARDILFSMFYSLQQADKVRLAHQEKEGFEYDWVVRARFDSAIFDKVEFEEHDHSKAHFYNIFLDINKPVVCDWLWFANSENMSHSCNVYDNMKQFWNVDEHVNSGENLTTAQLEKCNVPYEKHRRSLQLIRNGVPSNKHGQRFT